MSISSINSNLAALYAQQNISSATNATSSAVSALSSGNRLVNASTDVAALAIGTALQGQVSTLNTVVSSLSQGSSLLQVADGGLAQIETILQRQQAIATEAQSGSLSSTQLGFLNQEFQALTSQVDSLASSTNFNGVNLLNGGIQGGTTIATNTNTGSNTTPPAAKIGTIVTNTGLAGTTFTLTVAGQPAVTFTFGSSTSDVGVGSTVGDTAANLASALNNSGLSELSDLRFTSDTSGNISAYYTGSAATIANIPSVTSSASAAGTIVSNTGLASFTTTTSIATVTGTLNTGNTITIGSHTISFDTNGTLTTAHTGQTNAYGTVDADYTVSGQNITIDLGVATTTPSVTTVTQNTLSNIAAALNAVAGGTGFTDLAGISFGSTATQLTATYAGASATPPTISTSFASATPATYSNSGSAQVVTVSGAPVLSVGGYLDIADGETSFTIGGYTANISASATSGTTTTSATIHDGGNLSSTLANVAAYLNLNSSSLGSGYANLVFSTNGTQILASNPTGATITATAAATFANSDTGITANAHAGQGLASGATATILGTATTYAAGNTITIGGVTATLVDSGGSAANNTVTLGASQQATAAALASYFNGKASTIEAALQAGSTLAFTADGSDGGITVANTGTSIASPNLALTEGVSVPSDITVGASGTVYQLGAGIGTFSGTIGAGDTINVGGTTITVEAAGTSLGSDQILAGATLSSTLANLVTFLNTSGSTGTAGTSIATTGTPTLTIGNTVFATNGSELFATNDVGTTTGSVTVTYTPISNPTFQGVVGANLEAISSIGLGAGTTSAVGTPSGNLFVTNTGAASTSNYGNAVDLSGVANNASFVGAFGGTGSIGAITANYINTGTTSNSGAQFSVTVGNDTYTTGTITNAQLSASAPVSLVFTGSSNSAPAGGSFTLTLQGNQAEITNTTGASQLATGINDALSSVTAYQNRGVLSYNNNYSAEVGGIETATLQGSSLTFNSGNFSNPLVSSVTVSSPSTGSTDAKISVVVNGQTFSTIAGIGDTFKTDSTITLENSANPNQTLTLTTGGSALPTSTSSVAIDLSSSSNAAAFQTALSNALGLNNAGAGLTFQAGTSTTSTIGVSLGSATSASLFGGKALDVLSQGDASTAYNTLSTALDTISSLRATVGALEERFNYATSALQNASQNEGAAKSNLLDTDVAATSTSFATSQVQLQAGIAVLAQANQLQQNLLKLIQ